MTLDVDRPADNRPPPRPQQPPRPPRLAGLRTMARHLAAHPWPPRRPIRTTTTKEES